MDNLDLGSLNYWAILIAVVFNQVLGAAWYTVWAKPWMADVGLTIDDMESMKGTPRQWYPYLIAVVAGVVFTIGLALLVQGLGAQSAAEGLLVGILAAVGFIFTSNAINYAFEGRGLRLFAINCGYPLISYSVIGIVLATWS
ncbi:MAG: DUF1761 domain-containing protein [Acidimicrobiia bacterium]|nr:DUF1761 domain-containing protein [Acidimicrobiia bacterium]MCY4456650.1 DUF1761 domain-containing protein [Acidimicrobiaceae bacterium]